MAHFSSITCIMAMCHLLNFLKTLSKTIYFPAKIEVPFWFGDTAFFGLPPLSFEQARRLQQRLNVQEN